MLHDLQQQDMKDVLHDLAQYLAYAFCAKRFCSSALLVVKTVNSHLG